MNHKGTKDTKDAQRRKRPVDSITNFYSNPVITMRLPMFYALCVCCFAVFASGCGSGLQTLKGKVTYDDGSPVPYGVVIFAQGNVQSRGNIQSDGTYTVGTISEKDGLPPGEYQVYLANVFEEKGVDSAGVPIVVSLVAEKYTQAETSGLIYKTGAAKTFDITVERAK